MVLFSYAYKNIKTWRKSHESTGRNFNSFGAINLYMAMPTVQTHGGRFLKTAGRISTKNPTSGEVGFFYIYYLVPKMRSPASPRPGTI